MTILQWRSPDLVLDTIVDPAHRAFLTGDKVEAVGLESFKAKVMSLATAPPPPPPRGRRCRIGVSIDGPIFINANLDDQPLAETVFEKARLRKLPLVLSHPVGTAEEVRQDFERNWRECDSVVLIYGSAAADLGAQPDHALQQAEAGAREAAPRIHHAQLPAAAEAAGRHRAAARSRKSTVVAGSPPKFSIAWCWTWPT